MISSQHGKHFYNSLNKLTKLTIARNVNPGNPSENMASATPQKRGLMLVFMYPVKIKAKRYNRIFCTLSQEWLHSRF